MAEECEFVTLLGAITLDPSEFPSKHIDVTFYSYEQIPFLEAQLAQFHRLGNTKKQGMVEEKLKDMRERHAKVARVMRLEAERFMQKFPRELRDMVYRNLYVKSEEIKVWPRIIDNKIHICMPRDEAMYLSWHHVGPVALEAAEVFYRENTFHMNMQGDDSFQNIDAKRMVEVTAAFLNTDHYGTLPPESRTGPVPPMIQNFHISLPLIDRVSTQLLNGQFVDPFSIAMRGERHFGPPPSDLDFELEYQELFTQDDATDLRAWIWSLLHEYPFKKLTISYIGAVQRLLNAFRTLQPVVRKIRTWHPCLKLKVVELDSDAQWGPELDRDITDGFDDPSPADLENFETIGPRPLFELDFHSDPLVAAVGWYKRDREVPITDHLISAGGMAYMRVLMKEYNDAREFCAVHMQTLREIAKMKREVEDMTPEARAIRFAFFPRVMQQFTAQPLVPIPVGEFSG
ncbi:hypothetical protein EJ06DRAFT_385347 [Trichodelitschia bisporula]|uniref:Uncharacterized protein n=1 Tax=Trichodelitschia bisporula TaxID=703511 RepID=A0A6G1HZY7_9PEZI|nr:hypothetical protein EJ06DRAFT_385347 [Trichodelitschia bisporula]